MSRNSTLDKICEKEGARSGYRLRVEYLPGPAVCPNSEEEAEWLRGRESLLVTVLVSADGGRVLVSWVSDAGEGSHELDLSPAQAEAWQESLAACGGWSLAGFAPLPLGEGIAEPVHEAYSYHDADPDSLDLSAWQPPRRWRIERARGEAGEEGAARGLLALYRGFLGEAFCERSRLGPLFGG